MRGDTLELVAPDPDVEHKRGARSVGNHYRLEASQSWKGPFHLMVPSQGSLKKRSHWDAVEILRDEPTEGFPRYLSRVHGVGTYWVVGTSTARDSKGEKVRIRFQVTPRMAEAFGVTVEPPRRENPPAAGLDLIVDHLREQNASMRAELAELRAALMAREEPAEDLDEDDIADRVAERLAERQPNPAPSPWTPERVAQIASTIGPLLRQVNPPPPPPSPWKPIIDLFERTGQTPESILAAIERSAAEDAAAAAAEG